MPLDPITIGLLAGAGIGLLKGKMDADRAKDVEGQTRMMRASEQRYSPWTGITDFTPVRPAGSAFGTMLGTGTQGAIAGGMLGSGFGGAQNTPIQQQGTSPWLYNRYGQTAYPGLY
jgi:hypothetical protein